MFPLFVVIGAQVRSSYMIYLTYVDEGSKQGQLEFNREAEVPSLKAKFVLDEEKGSDGLVHIRSCCNNKYWTIEDNTKPKSFIKAAAKEKVGDTKSAKCTLFRAQKWDAIVKFTHVQTGYLVHVDSSTNCLCIENQTHGTDFEVTDYEIFVLLPKRVIFKGDNGKYLQEYKNVTYAPTDIPGGKTDFIQIENRFTATDAAEPTAQYEIFHYNNCIRIKCVHNNKFLRLFANENPIIFAESDDTTTNNVLTLFEVILAENSGSNVIALRSRSNNKFCGRAEVSGLAKFFSFIFPTKSSDALYASETHTKKQTLFTVEEPVITRKIHLDYHLEEAIIIERVPGLRGAPAEILNNSTKDEMLPYTFKYVVNCESSWKTSTNLLSNVKTEINLDIPKVKGGEFSVGWASESIEAQQKQIEKMDRRSYQDETTRYFQVPAMTKASINWYVEELTFEIPFSYIQTDRLNDGTIEEHTFKDGTYRGMQGHEVICDHIKYEPLH